MSPGFAPVPRQSVSDGVFHELRDAVLDGRFAPGESLPPERQLAESFAVNRHAVREAVKRLQEAGFVRVVHGGGTAVLDVRRTAGLDLLVHLARAEGEPASRIIRDGLEMRRCVGVEAARLAARRGTPRPDAALWRPPRHTGVLRAGARTGPTARSGQRSSTRATTWLSGSPSTACC